MSEYTQGVCHDGAAILKDGEMMTIEEILSELAQLPTLREATRWIPVSERRPEDTEMKILVFSGNAVFPTIWKHMKQVISKFPDKAYSHYWMSLPEPPKSAESHE